MILMYISIRISVMVKNILWNNEKDKNCFEISGFVQVCNCIFEKDRERNSSAERWVTLEPLPENHRRENDQCETNILGKYMYLAISEPLYV